VTSANKNKMLPILIFAVLLIWGIIAYKIIDYYFLFSDNEPEIITENPVEKKRKLNKIENNDNSLFTESIERNPFSFAEKTIVQEKPVDYIPAPVIQREIIDFTINGVITGSGRKLVILEDKTNNSTQFLREKETYKMIKIIKIEEGQVKVKIYNGTRDIAVQ